MHCKRRLQESAYNPRGHTLQNTANNICWAGKDTNPAAYAMRVCRYLDSLMHWDKKYCRLCVNPHNWGPVDESPGAAPEKVNVAGGVWFLMHRKACYSLLTVQPDAWVWLCLYVIENRSKTYRKNCFVGSFLVLPLSFLQSYGANIRFRLWGHSQPRTETLRESKRKK